MEPNLSQALHLLNGDTVNGRVQNGGVVRRLLKAGKTIPEIVEELYITCLSRRPTEKEIADLNPFFKDAKVPEVILNDLFWSLLNAKEFVFNH